MSALRMLVDGVDTDRVGADDRGLSYGDGVFETIAVADGQPRHWTRHLERLQTGARRLGFAAPPADVLEREVAASCSGIERGVLRLTVTRGRGGRGYRPPRDAEPTRIIALHPWPDYPPRWHHDGIRLRTCRTRLGANPALAGIKHLNRLEQVMARAEWDDPEVPEALMRDYRGRVVAGTMSNVFAVRDGTLSTPDLSRCGVAGVTRARVLEAAQRAGVPTRIETLWLRDLQQADEVFVSNSIVGVWPVRGLDNVSYSPGPLTARLAREAERG